jgi:hypothetical protein
MPQVRQIDNDFALPEPGKTGTKYATPCTRAYEYNWQATPSRDGTYNSFLLLPAVISIYMTGKIY